jgi:hypothetical protein
MCRSPREDYTVVLRFLRNRINRVLPPASTFAELSLPSRVVCQANTMEEVMGLGRGALLWLLGVPLPIIILLALFWHH